MVFNIERRLQHRNNMLAAKNHAINLMENNRICVINICYANDHCHYPVTLIEGYSWLGQFNHLPSSGNLKRISFNYYSCNGLIVEDFHGRKSYIQDMPVSEAKKVIAVIEDVVSNHLNDDWVKHYGPNARKEYIAECKKFHKNPETNDPNAYCRYDIKQDEHAHEYDEEYTYQAFKSVGCILSRQDLKTNLSGETDKPWFYNSKTGKYVNLPYTKKEKKGGVIGFIKSLF